MSIQLNTIKHHSTASYILDLLRFISAFVVFLYHFHFNLPGYQAVMVFFVLSGYFISTSVIKSIKEGTWSWKIYLIKRCVRLWIVLIPALVLTYVWAIIQVHFFGSTPLFYGVLNIKTLLGNLLFTQDILVKQYGLNGPLWSLTYEFWYYILFPCALLIFYSKRRKTKLFYFIGVMGIGLFVGKQIMLYFVIWLLGALIAIVKPFAFKKSSVNYFVLFILMAVAGASTKGLYTFYDAQTSWMNPYFVPDLSVGIAFALLIYWVINLFGAENSNGQLFISKELAGFSYTLYLVHYPLLYFWNAWTSSPYWHIDDKHTLGVKIIFFAAIIVYAYILAKVTEFKTAKVTSMIFNILKKYNFLRVPKGSKRLETLN
ncbi:acyltransferase family protein (plasmid) [Priestia megaterium]|uniref:Acyltransferase family protein n=1 Tax=Priestia megaterium TaxID=1404 RepID=A0A6M6E6L9_PRIMG|nr:acyltransferase family protein [Priestia megaterium]